MHSEPECFGCDRRGCNRWYHPSCVPESVSLSPNSKWFCPLCTNLPKKLLKYVNRTGPSLRNKLVQMKQLSLNINYSKTLQCHYRNCRCCSIISEESTFSINGQKILVRSGSCTSYNIIYCVCCKHCGKCYGGRTIQRLNERIGQHRSNYIDIISDLHSHLLDNSLCDNDDYSLGFHLVRDHDLTSKSSFNESYEVFIIDICSPRTLEVNEHRFIHKAKTIRPFGINSQNPFSIPLLNY